MPLVKNYHCEAIPEWSEVKKVTHHYLKEGESLRIDTGCSKAAIFVYAGVAHVEAQGKSYDLCCAKPAHAPLDSIILNCGTFIVSTSTFPGYWLSGCEIYVIAGEWPGWAVISNFQVENSRFPVNTGDPIDYETKTTFDNHYHDFDEYWLVAEGGGKVLSEGILYDVEPGDLIITKRGTHHCFVEARGWTRCVAFKARLGGKTRMDNLYVHTHGKPPAD